MVARPPVPKARARAIAALLGLLLPLSCGGDPQGVGRGRGVLLIAIDGLRADHLSGLGYDRRTTPVLDRLAEQGLSFDECISTAPQLIPAHLSLLTGCYPIIGQRSDEIDTILARRWRLPPAAPALAVELLVGGYSTVLFADHEWLSPAFGFDRGFEEFHAFDPGDEWLPQKSGIEGVGHGFLQWLYRRDSDENWFAYLHLSDLERAWRSQNPDRDTQFEPRRELSEIPPVGHTDPIFFAIPRSRWRGASRTLGYYEARYDGALHQLDRSLEGVFQAIQEAGRWEDTTVVVVGSFGLQFGEAGLILDHGRLSVADLHVPWIVRPARGLEAERGRSLDGLASLADVAPTILELCGLPVPGGMHGQSQVPALRGTGVSERPHVFASCSLQDGFAAFGTELTYELTKPGRASDPGLVRSWFGDHESHDNDVREQFYDRRSQPYPALDAPTISISPEAERIRAAGASWWRRMELTRKAYQRASLLGGNSITDEERADLVRLGYLGADF